MLFPRWSKSSPFLTPNAGRTRKCAAPRLEVLEDRLSPAVRVWAGLGLDNVWSNHANWVGNVLPVPNDDLVFPANAPRLVNVNNLPGYIFNSITLSGPNYLITGNPISIRGPGIAQTVAGTNTFELLTVFIGPEVRPLAVATGGSLQFNAELTGPGGFAKTGGGTLVLGGVGVNTYASVTTVQEGTLVLGKAAGSVAIPGELILGDGVGGLESDLVRLTSPGQLAPAQVTVNGSGLLDLNGFGASLPRLTLNGGRVETGAAALSLTGSLITTRSAAPAVIRGVLDFGADPREIAVADGESSNDLIVQARVVAQGPLTKSGTGRLVLAAANELGATVTVAAGSLQLRHSGALGSTEAGTVIAQGGVLELGGGINLGAEPLAMTTAGTSSSLVNLDGRNSWAGTITLLNDARIAVTDGRLELTGSILTSAGSWGLTKTGPGTLALGGDVSNAVPGMILVAEGMLALGKTAGAAAVIGPLVVGDATAPQRAASVRLEGAEQIADDSTVSLAGGGSIDLNGFRETVGPLTFSGGTISTGAGVLRLAGDVRLNAANVPVTITGNLALTGPTRVFTLTRGSGNEDLLITATIQGTASLVKQGTGVLRLTGNNTYTAATTLVEGTLLVDGNVPGTVMVQAGATLGGKGSVGAATLMGTINPSPTVAALRIGTLSCGSGSTFRAHLNGMQAGTSYDQVTVNRPPNLAGASLAASLGFRSLGGSRYLIVNNTSDAPVSGTFAGLPEGARLTVSGRPFTMSYRGGDGNDVVLTDASRPTSTTVTLGPMALTGTRGLPGVPRIDHPLLLSLVVQAQDRSGTPTGRVTVRDVATGKTYSGDLLNGVAGVSITGLGVGNHTFQAEYDGDSTFSPSSSEPMVQALGKALISLRLHAAPNPVRADQSLTFTATLSTSSAGQPTGSVTFRHNGRDVATATLQPNGTATWTVSGLALGSHSWSAFYSGDDTFEQSLGSVSVEVTRAYTPEEQFVTQVFQDVLNRAVDPQGLAAWSQLVRQGTVRGQIVQAIQESEEGRTLVVQSAYQRFLRRQADAGGLRAFVTFLSNGGTSAQLHAALVASPEYYQLQGGSTDRGWLSAAYRDVFNRAPEAAGQAAHLAGLAESGRQRIADIIFASSEHRSNLVRDLYQKYLRRSAESTGLAAFVTELARGARPEQLAAAIIGSGEYATRVVR